MTHQCNSYCKHSEHCDMVFTGDTELHIAALRITQILKSNHGVQVVKVQSALQPAIGDSLAGSPISRAGWWLAWWTGHALDRAA
ncbi:MAG: hypothetical protein O2909_03160 [Chloroflexi bacterium]|nr:hypothetical protein [Chloroflexota bacterium]MDA1218421.1 hypothetical protein [Chloroflexota bacterium]PKB57426.1 MAG: hypothetical protein BZY73_03245 [SAR202 cluster bacterium Casp-Chloro-G3]